MARKATGAKHEATASQASNPKPQANPFYFVRGLLAEMFEADVEHALLVEAALGEHQQSLVVNSLADVCNNGGSEAIAALAGRVTFIAVDQCPIRSSEFRVPSSESKDKEQQADAPDSSTPNPELGTRNFLPCLIDLVRFPAEIAPIAWSLLSRTFVVSDLALRNNIAN